jgi:hypothetical protein
MFARGKQFFLMILLMELVFETLGFGSSKFASKAGVYSALASFTCVCDGGLLCCKSIISITPCKHNCDFAGGV